MSRQFPDARAAIKWSVDSLMRYGAKVDSGRWQGIPTEGKPDLMTQELIDLSVCFPCPNTAQQAEDLIGPNMPWAEDHFKERVSRVPSNPGKEYENWPWWHPTKESKTKDVYRDDIDTFLFTHTYQERFWPKYAGGRHDSHPTAGIRYNYGDLDDVVKLLRSDPHSRQAYLPIFFPEDTGAVHGGRIPCTLGYHFLLRHELLHCWYDIRSCDAVRHFRDDLYLAARLVQWVLAELVESELGDLEDLHWVDVYPGTLFFNAHSFHVHMGDYRLLES